jgi:hypothetical protein
MISTPCFNIPFNSPVHPSLIMSWHPLLRATVVSVFPLIPSSGPWFNKQDDNRDFQYCSVYT